MYACVLVSIHWTMRNSIARCITLVIMLFNLLTHQIITIAVVVVVVVVKMIMVMCVIV